MYPPRPRQTSLQQADAQLEVALPGPGEPLRLDGAQGGSEDEDGEEQSEAGEDAKEAIGLARDALTLSQADCLEGRPVERGGAWRGGEGEAICASPISRQQA
jgi:hypothetical protein